MAKIFMSVVGMVAFLVGTVLSFRDGAEGKDWSAGFLAGVGIAAFIIANSAQVTF